MAPLQRYKFVTRVRRHALGCGIFLLLMLPTILLLRFEGRSWWCSCGGAALWVGDIWCVHTSQHLFDPYSFTHVLHGMAFCGLAWLAFRRLGWDWRFLIAMTIESSWEVLENSAFIIHRYRSVTIGLGYEGDSILNSLSDVACCMLGFLLAQRLEWRWSCVVFVAMELVLLLWIRDNLTLNVLMLLWPIETIKNWQMAF
jgi:hypothetical protein